jgi:hypothetical protein
MEKNIWWGGKKVAGCHKQMTIGRSKKKKKEFRNKFPLRFYRMFHNFVSWVLRMTLMEI